MEIVVSAGNEFVDEDGWIVASAFKGRTDIDSVVFGEGVRGIGANAFSGCTGLKELTIPGNVRQVGVRAFKDCTGLTSLTVLNESEPSGSDEKVSRFFRGLDEDEVRTIDEGAFRGCANLESVEIVGHIHIGKNAFRKCEKLSSLKMWGVMAMGFNFFMGSPNVNVCVIGDSAFRACKSLTTLSIWSSTVLDPNAFRDCGKLSNVNLSGVIDMGVGAFAGWGLGPEMTIVRDGWLRVWPGAEGDVTVPGYLEGIAAGAFAGCKRLKSLTIEDGVTAIGEWAFTGCGKLASITIPKSVTRIGQYAFENCKSLTEIAIPEGIDLDESVFAGCKNLKKITRF